MTNIISAFLGALIAVMIMFNGTLSYTMGNYTSSVIIHIIGLFAIILVLIISKSKIKIVKEIPLYLYSAGAIGVFTVLFNNLTFLKLGVSVTLALGLLGQSLSSILIDHFGLFGMNVIRFAKKKCIGLLFITFGIYMMTTFRGGLMMIYILIAILAGVSIVVARIINSNLALRIGIFQGTFYNYVIGLFFSILFLFLNNEALMISKETMKSVPLWAYLGGLTGVLVIVLSSYLTPKISAFYFTLLMFLGQLFVGIIIDYFTLNILSIGKIVGGFSVLVGLNYNLLIDKNESTT